MTDASTSGPSRTSLRDDLGTWLRALRLQFYPMSWVAYTIGALAAVGAAAFASAAYWVGFGFMFFLEVAVVLSNEYVDYETDRRNAHAGQYTGGSRVLVEDALSFRELRAGTVVALAVSGAFGAGVLWVGAGPVSVMAALMVVLAVLAAGYTVPPLKLSYRTLGELDVAVTDSVGVLLCGYVFLGGRWTDPAPWLLSVPFLLAVLPSITLAGVPDCAADRAAGKRTVAVRVGVRGAALVAAVTTVLAALTGVLWWLHDVVPGAYGPLVLGSVLHALVVLWLLYDRLAGATGARRIDDLMVASLSYLVWFGVVPLVGLL